MSPPSLMALGLEAGLRQSPEADLETGGESCGFLAVEGAVVVTGLGALLEPRTRWESIRARAAAARWRKAPVVIAPSRHAKVILQSLFRFPAHRVWKASPGPGLHGIAEPAGPTAVQAGEEFLLGSGGWRNPQAWRRMFAAVARAEMLNDAPLVLTGAPRPARRDLADAARRAGLSAGRLVFADAPSDAERLGLFNAARAVVSPSLCEAAPLALLCAAACNRPCVAPRIPPMNEAHFPHALFYEPDEMRTAVKALNAAWGWTPPADAPSLPTWPDFAREVIAAVGEAREGVLANGGDQ